MTKEIKEILHKLNEIYINNKENIEVRVLGISPIKIKLLLDYITNLQEDIEEYKRIEEADFNLIQDLEDTIVDKKECIVALSTSITKLHEENDRLKEWKKDLDEVLNILKGE